MKRPRQLCLGDKQYSHCTSEPSSATTNFGGGRLDRKWEPLGWFCSQEGHMREGYPQTGVMGSLWYVRLMNMLEKHYR